MNMKPVFPAILAALLAFSLGFAACNNGGGGLSGQTFKDEYGTTLAFSDSEFTIKDDYEAFVRGTYTEADGIVTCTVTWVHSIVSFPGMSVGAVKTMTLSGNTLTDEDGDTWTKQGGAGN